MYQKSKQVGMCKNPPHYWMCKISEQALLPLLDHSLVLVDKLGMCIKSEQVGMLLLLVLVLLVESLNVPRTSPKTGESLNVPLPLVECLKTRTLRYISHGKALTTLHKS